MLCAFHGFRPYSTTTLFLLDPVRVQDLPNSCTQCVDPCRNRYVKPPRATLRPSSDLNTNLSAAHSPPGHLSAREMRTTFLRNFSDGKLPSEAHERSEEAIYSQTSGGGLRLQPSQLSCDGPKAHYSLVLRCLAKGDEVTYSREPPMCRPNLYGIYYIILHLLEIIGSPGGRLCRGFRSCQKHGRDGVCLSQHCCLA